MLLAVLLARGFAPALFFPTDARPHSAHGPGARAEYSQGLDVFQIPQPTPDFSFADASGRPMTLAAFRGRDVLLNIWATWCIPCRKEMPALDRLAQTLGGPNFVVLPLSIDRGGVAVVRHFFRELDLGALPIFVDRSANVTSALAVPGLPTTFLLDRNGREIARKIGPADWADPQMRALIRRVLAPRGNGTKEARL
jgi:thiol-disulfide isomerase/thioredoxin